jgi:hypothetical protein
MDFLRRLAPTPHAGTPRALPLLAPRFAAAPLGLAAGDANHDPLGADHEQAGGPAGAPAQVTPRPGAPAAMAPARPWHTRPGAASSVNADGPLAGNASNHVPHTFAASTDQLAATALQRVQPSAPSAQASRDLDTAAVPRAANRTPERTSERTSEHTNIHPNIHPNSRATWAPQATATPHAAPLSAAALAAAVAAAASAGNTARQPSRSQAPPVIHVTIDRIDVRAAPGPTRPASAPRGTHHTPTVSLADYLRGGSA